MRVQKMVPARGAVLGALVAWAGYAAASPVGVSAQAGPEVCADRGPALAEEAWRRLRELAATPAPAEETVPAPRADADTGHADPRALRSAVEPLVAKFVALDHVAQRTLGEDRWRNLPQRRKEDFRQALARHLAAEAVRSLAAAGPSSHAETERLIAPVGPPKRHGDILEIPVSVASPAGERALWVWFSLRDDEGCRLVDLRGGGRRIWETLRDRVKSLVNDYSFAYMVAKVGDYDIVTLEDFEANEVGDSLPFGWDWRDSDRKKPKPYRIREEDGNRYLEARDEGQSVILGSKVRWNLDEYPYVSFRVRVWRIPEGGDERTDDKVDSAAGIYFTLKRKFFGKIPESVKYVWSSTLPVGTAVRREGIGKPFQVVFGTDKQGLGEWHTYIFDVRQAYRDTFGGEPPPKTEGIGILSDANSLKSQAYADYDDIRALRSAPPGTGSGVLKVVPPVKNR
ncbi:MAG: DUF3047 domain-containing protein [Gemmatimonadota bacterium]